MGPEAAISPFGPALAFCLGATKAGTGWLYEYLRGHPDCHLRSVKELHYFDAVDFGTLQWQLDDLARRRAACLAEGGREAELADIDALAALLARAADAGAADEKAYLDYLRGGIGAERLVADITPAYALLSRARLARMARIAPVVRFVYILREPVARLWSHLQMIAARKARRPEDIPRRTRRLFWRYGRGELPGVAARGDYAGTLSRLNAALRPGQLLVLFFEEMFSQSSMDRLCAFLGLRPHPAPVGLRVHGGPGLPMKPAQRQHARVWLAPQYDHVREALGYLPEPWRTNMPEVPA